MEIRADPEIAKWLGSPEPWRDEDQARTEINVWTARLESPDVVGTWAIVPTGDDPLAGRPVGSVSLSRIRMGEETEIGWYLHPEATGRGWAGDAASAVLLHALSAGVPRVWALMWRDNEPSARVARAIGMRELGVLVDPWYGSEQDAYSRMFVARPDTHPHAIGDAHS